MSKKKRDLWIGICIGNYKIRNGTTHPIELDKKTIKDFQSICDDYGKMFSTKLKMELGNPNLIGGYITDEDDFKLDMDRWLNDVDYYYDIFENHRKLFSKITFYIEHRFNQFCNELKELFLHFGDKNHMGELLEEIWKFWGENYTDEEMEEILGNMKWDYDLNSFESSSYENTLKEKRDGGFDELFGGKKVGLC